MNRRQFLLSGAAVTAGLFIPQIACANTEDYWVRDRILWMRRLNGEEFRVVYWSGGLVDVNNYVRLCYLLRDAHESQTVMMDVNLLNLLYGIQHWQEILVGHPVPLIINSGYRTNHTNNRTEGSKKNSMHLYGRAADITCPGFKPKAVADMATFFGLGGVGKYETFTHVDSGQVRYWNGKSEPRKHK